jgi:HlyD family secretion protein
MNKLIVLTVLALAGITFASWSAAKGQRLPPIAEPVVAPATTPFASTVAGAGLVEPQGDIVRIGAPLGDVIADVLVTPGASVTAGTPLLRLDDRATKAQEVIAQANLTAARAAVSVAQTAREEAKDNASRATDDVLSREERARRVFALASAETRLIQAETAVTQAEAALTAVRVELDRRIVRAPRAGTILRVDARPGEFAPAGRIDPALITMGDVTQLQLRVDIDENDSWRVVPGAKAEGAVRGNPALRTPLKFVRIEPYVVPKKSLTGASSERVDTRVLQVIYRVERSDLRIYVGQQMDVFIDAAEATATATATSSAPSTGAP